MGECGQIMKFRSNSFEKRKKKGVQGETERDGLTNGKFRLSRRFYK